ncbi:MAG: Ribosomal large subunit pseudouridine synthase D, partial [uncultured Rubrobacteraceae bacterium]
ARRGRGAPGQTYRSPPRDQQEPGAAHDRGRRRSRRGRGGRALAQGEIRGERRGHAPGDRPLSGGYSRSRSLRGRPPPRRGQTGRAGGASGGRESLGDARQRVVEQGYCRRGGSGTARGRAAPRSGHVRVDGAGKGRDRLLGARGRALGAAGEAPVQGGGSRRRPPCDGDRRFPDRTAPQQPHAHDRGRRAAGDHALRGTLGGGRTLYARGQAGDGADTPDSGPPLRHRFPGLRRPPLRKARPGRPPLAPRRTPRLRAPGDGRGDGVCGRDTARSSGGGGGSGLL